MIVYYSMGRSLLTIVLASFIIFTYLNAHGSTISGPNDTLKSLIASQNWSGAEEFLTKAYASSPSSALAEEFSKVLVRLNKREQALELIKKHDLYKQIPIVSRVFITQQSYSKFSQGLSQIEQNKFSVGCELLEKAHELDLLHADILLKLAQCEVLIKKPDSALKKLELYEKWYGPLPEITLWTGRAHFLKNDPLSALALLIEAQKRLPKSELAPLWISDCHDAKSSPTSSIQTLKNDLIRNPKHLGAELLLYQLLSVDFKNETQDVLKTYDSKIRALEVKAEDYLSKKNYIFESDASLELRNRENFYLVLNNLKKMISSLIVAKQQ